MRERYVFLYVCLLIVATIIAMNKSAIASQPSSSLNRETDSTEDVIEQLLNECERLLEEKQYEKAIVKLEHMIATSKQTKNELKLRKVYAELGLAYMAFAYEDALDFLSGDEKLKKGISYIEKSLEMWKKDISSHLDSNTDFLIEEERSSYATACMQLGIPCVEIGDFKRKLRWSEEALETLNLVKDKKLLSIQLLPTIMVVGNTCEDCGHLGRALECYEKGLSLVKDGKLDIPSWSVCDFLISVSTFYEKIGCTEKADRYAKEAIQLIKKNDSDQWRVGNAIVRLGDVEMLAGNYDEALSNYETALKTAKDANDAVGMNKALAGIGDVLYAKGKYDQAMNKYEEAGVNFHFVDIVRLTRGYLKLDKPIFALDIAQSRLYRAQKIENAEELIEAYNCLGEVLEFLAEHTSSVGYYPEQPLESGLKYVPFSLLSPRSIAIEKESCFKDSVKCFENASSLLEKLSSTVPIEAYRKSFISNKVFIYDNLSRVLMKLHQLTPDKGYDKEASYYAEKSKVYKIGQR